MENERRGKKQGEGCRVVALIVGAQRSRGRSPHNPWKSHAHKAVRTWYLNGSRCDASGVANSSYVGQVSRPCAEPRPRRMSRKAFIGSARDGVFVFYPDFKNLIRRTNNGPHRSQHFRLPDACTLAEKRSADRTLWSAAIHSMPGMPGMPGMRLILLVAGWRA